MMRLLPLAALLLSLAAPGFLHAQEAPHWTVAPGESAIDWTAKWNTTPVHGGFERFSADIRFDPEALGQSGVRVKVDIGSIYLKGQDARATLVNENWFDAGQHPEALFESTAIRHLGSGRYEADGRLSIKGVARDVTLPFKLTIEGSVARMEGSLMLDRNDFSLGASGDVAKAVAAGVAVAVKVTARRD